MGGGGGGGESPLSGVRLRLLWAGFGGALSKDLGEGGGGGGGGVEVQRVLAPAWGGRERMAATLIMAPTIIP